MFDIDLLNIKDIILIFLVIAVIYLLFFKEDKEHFTTEDDIKHAVNEQYKADIEAIRNLSVITTEIMRNDDNLTLPTNISIPGDLTVNGNVIFTNKNANIMELFPKYMIVALNLPPTNSSNQSNIPRGWAICDGNYYSLNETGYAILSDSVNGIKTPDLKGRFILGVGTGVGLTPRNFTDPNGGEESVTLTEQNIPSHNHGYHRARANNAIGSELPDIGSGTGYMGIKLVDESTANYGGSKSHNNMPPYTILTYIMKL